MQESGMTPVDFTQPFTHTITAADGSTRNYVVTVNVAPPTSVSFSGLTANGTSGTITTTALTLSFSADPTGLDTANIIVTGTTRGTLCFRL